MSLVSRCVPSLPGNSPRCASPARSAQSKPLSEGRTLESTLHPAAATGPPTAASGASGSICSAPPPICFEPAAVNAPEREVAAEILATVELSGYTVIADKDIAGEDFGVLIGGLGAVSLRPDRKDEQPRFGSLGGVRQWVGSVIEAIRVQLSLERHDAHTLPYLLTRIARRLLALAAFLFHNWDIGDPGRRLIANDH